VCTLLVLLAGCGPIAPVTPDAGGMGDGGPALLSCPTPPGPTWVVSKFALLPVDQGFDLVGDGKVHNILGTLAPFANTYWSTSAQMGFSIFLLDFPGLASPNVDAKDFPFNFFVGIDVDDPVDPSNNLDGTGQFYVPIEQLDVNCQPTSAFHDTVLSGGTLTADTKLLDIVAQAIGDFQSSDDVLKATFAPDGSTVDGVIGGVSTPCAMTKVSSPIAGLGNFTLLDSIVNVFNLQPDIDRNKDGGLDRLVGDGGKVTSCVLADGTVIEGHSCACDQRMADGYSLAFSFSAVPAIIVGLAHRN
jgi:hypothetical protein